MKAKAYDFFREVKQYVDKHGMLKPGDGVIAGVSGGADSMCLLHILCALRQEYGFELFVVHVNHGIRGADADMDQEFVRLECARMSVPFKAVREDVRALAAQWGLTQEEAGRRVRYRTFHKEAEERGCKRIAVAHNENDNAETFLFQALRGSGVWGLSGIAPVRQEEGRTIIRPLLGMARSRIVEFLESRGQAYCTDKTNFSGDYARNRIRNELLPAAADMVNAAAVSHLAQAATRMYELTSYLRGQVEEAYYKVATETCCKVGEEACCKAANEVPVYNSGEVLPETAVQSQCGDGEDGILAGTKCRNIELEISSILALPEFLQKEVLLYAVCRATGSRRDITGAHINALFSLISRGTGGCINLPGGLLAKVQYGKMYIGVGNRVEDVDLPRMGSGEVFWMQALLKGLEQNIMLGSYELSLRLIDGKSVNIRTEIEKNSRFARNCYTKCFDYDTIENILILRTKQPGDYLVINGGRNRKRLKKLLVDEKVPVELRDTLAVLAAGSHVLWAVGVRSTEGFRVTENTKQILVVELKKKGQELQWQKR